MKGEKGLCGNDFIYQSSVVHVPRLVNVDKLCTDIFLYKYFARPSCEHHVHALSCLVRSGAVLFHFSLPSLYVLGQRQLRTPSPTGETTELYHQK